MQRITSRLSKYISFCVLFIVIGLLLISMPIQRAAAQGIESKGLTLSPLRTELNIMPGTLSDGVLITTNSTDKPIVVQLSAEEFSVVNQQYDYSFSSESGIAKWVKFASNNINLAAGESKQVSFSIAVPLNAEPGGRYLSLFASTDISDNDINSRQRVASLLYITVDGNVIRDGNLISLTSPWAISGDNMWSMTLQNTGTTHFRSRYNAVIKNILFDGEVANVSGDALVLPGTVRVVSDKMPMPQFPGLYKVIYTIGLGDKPAIVETRWLIYMPLWATIIIVICIIFIILALLRKTKKY